MTDDVEPDDTDTGTAWQDLKFVVLTALLSLALTSLCWWLNIPPHN